MRLKRGAGRWLMARMEWKPCEWWKPRSNRRALQSGSTSPSKSRSNKMKKVPLSRVFVNDEVREAGIRAMNSGWYILAKECEAFEAELAAYVGTNEAVHCSSWRTGALLLHHATGGCPGDETLVPSHTAFPSGEPLIHRRPRPGSMAIHETHST